jgi:hypothetical protein
MDRQWFITSQYCSVKVCNCQCSGQNHENSSLSASDKSQFLVIRTVLYNQYLSGCAATKDQYLQAESQARQQRLGFWNQQSPTMPWDGIVKLTGSGEN